MFMNLINILLGQTHILEFSFSYNPLLACMMWQRTKDRYNFKFTTFWHSLPSLEEKLIWTLKENVCTSTDVNSVILQLSGLKSFIRAGIWKTEQVFRNSDVFQSQEQYRTVITSP